jgi:5-methylcytosine-specific restriction endonuclease McrA
MMLAPYCAACKHRHDPALKHWWGSYRRRITARVLSTQGSVCWICGLEATTADHIIPRSKGGDDADANLRPACMPCNARRGNDDNPFDPDPAPRPAGLALSERWR